MALVDLSDYDVLELILADIWSDEEQFDLLETYMHAFSEVLVEGLGADLKEKDLGEMEKLTQDPKITPKKLMEFYTDRIPHMESKVLLLALAFKKDFVLGVYKNKLEEYKKSSDKEGQDAWEQIYKDAQVDNWNEVVRLLNMLRSIYTPKISAPSPN